MQAARTAAQGVGSTCRYSWGGAGRIADMRPSWLEHHPPRERPVPSLWWSEVNTSDQLNAVNTKFASDLKAPKCTTMAWALGASGTLAIMRPMRQEQVHRTERVLNTPMANPQRVLRVGG